MGRMCVPYADLCSGELFELLLQADPLALDALQRLRLLSQAALKLHRQRNAHINDDTARLFCFPAEGLKTALSDQPKTNDYSLSTYFIIKLLL